MDRYSCFFVSIADLLTLNGVHFHLKDSDDAHWLFPWLKDTDSPGTKIRTMLKSCQEKQTSRSKLRPVKSLPADSTTQGIRRGCINQLSTTMSGEFAIAATGHDLTHASAFYEYMSPAVAMIQPAANILSNWSLPTFGQLGYGPKAPTLDCLSERWSTSCD